MEAEGEDTKHYQGEGEEDNEGEDCGEGRFSQKFKDDANAKLIKSLLNKNGIRPRPFALEFLFDLRFKNKEDEYKNFLKNFRAEEVKDQRIRKCEIDGLTDLGIEGWENFNHFLKHITCYGIARFSGQGTVPFELIKEGFTHFTKKVSSQMYLSNLTLTKSHLQLIFEV